jgi:hypothetical protein
VTKILYANNGETSTIDNWNENNDRKIHGKYFNGKYFTPEEVSEIDKTFEEIRDLKKTKPKNPMPLS